MNEPTVSVKQKYEYACELARIRSKRFECAIHVNAYLKFDPALEAPVIAGFNVGDWSDGTTVASYEQGVRK